MKHSELFKLGIAAAPTVSDICGENAKRAGELVACLKLEQVVNCARKEKELKSLQLERQEMVDAAMKDRIFVGGESLTGLAGVAGKIVKGLNLSGLVLTDDEKRVLAEKRREITFAYSMRYHKGLDAFVDAAPEGVWQTVFKGAVRDWKEEEYRQSQFARDIREAPSTCEWRGNRLVTSPYNPAINRQWAESVAETHGRVPTNKSLWDYLDEHANDAGVSLPVPKQEETLVDLER